MNEEYRDLIAYLKILYQNFTVLHHNVVGSEFYAVHPLLGEFYDKVGEIADHLTERGMVDGAIKEPGIKDAVLKYGAELIDVGPFECHAAMKAADNGFVSLIEKMAVIRPNVAPDIQSTFDQYIDQIETERYKIQQFLGEEEDEDE